MIDRGAGYSPRSPTSQPGNSDVNVVSALTHARLGTFQPTWANRRLPRRRPQCSYFIGTPPCSLNEFRVFAGVGTGRLGFVNPSQLEERILKIDGIEAARVVEENSKPIEIHVIARHNKPAKQVVRDVQSLAAALFNVEIDRRIVSVVQLADSDLVGGDRPRIVDIEEAANGSTASVKVTLDWHDTTLVGEVSGAAARLTRNRQVGEAVLVALGQALVPEASFAVASIDVPILGSRPIAVAQIVVVTHQSERMVVGCSIVNDDESYAVVRSVLDALNRLVPDLRR